MTRMSNKLVYHFLRFNEPATSWGQSPRGKPHIRFLSSKRCIYMGGFMGGYTDIYGRLYGYIWEGQVLNQNTPGRAGFDTASHPFRGHIFQKGLCTLVLAGIVVFGSRERRQIYNMFSVGCTSCHVLPSPPLVQHNRDVLAAEGSDCNPGVFIYNIHPCCRGIYCKVSFTSSSSSSC